MKEAHELVYRAECERLGDGWRVSVTAKGEFWTPDLTDVGGDVAEFVQTAETSLLTVVDYPEGG